jgi:hypothetical protein
MAGEPQDAPRQAGQVVRRVLLRRNIAVDAETAQLVAAAAKAALQAGAPLRPRVGAPARSRRRQRAAVLTWHRPSPLPVKPLAQAPEPVPGPPRSRARW